MPSPLVNYDALDFRSSARSSTPSLGTNARRNAGKSGREEIISCITADFLRFLNSNNSRMFDELGTDHISAGFSNVDALLSGVNVVLNIS